MPNVPDNVKTRAVDSAGKETTLDVRKYGAKTLLYVASSWLSQAKYPVRFELKIDYPFTFCCVA